MNANRCFTCNGYTGPVMTGAGPQDREPKCVCSHGIREAEYPRMGFDERDYMLCGPPSRASELDDPLAGAPYGNHKLTAEHVIAEPGEVVE